MRDEAFSEGSVRDKNKSITIYKTRNQVIKKNCEGVRDENKFSFKLEKTSK